MYALYPRGRAGVVPRASDSAAAQAVENSRLEAAQKIQLRRRQKRQPRQAVIHVIKKPLVRITAEQSFQFAHPASGLDGSGETVQPGTSQPERGWKGREPRKRRADYHAGIAEHAALRRAKNERRVEFALRHLPLDHAKVRPADTLVKKEEAFASPYRF